MQKGDPPRLVEVQTPSTGGSAYYAIERGGRHAAVGQAVRRGQGTGRRGLDARCAARMQQEQAAAKLLAAVKGGQSLADAADGRRPSRSAGRRCHARRRRRGHAAAARAGAVRPEARRAHDGGDAGDGFIVAVPAEIVEARPEGGSGRLQPGARGGVPARSATTSPAVFADALRVRAQPQINQPVARQIVQSDSRA